MFQDRPKVQRVGFENDEMRSFDNITVQYEGLVESGEAVNGDRGSGPGNFADIAFISEKRDPLKHRLRLAPTKLGEECLVSIAENWLRACNTLYRSLSSDVLIAADLLDPAVEELQ
jgi:hypothetical protein